VDSPIFTPARLARSLRACLQLNIKYPIGKHVRTRLRATGFTLATRIEGPEETRGIGKSRADRAAASNGSRAEQKPHRTGTWDDFNAMLLVAKRVSRPAE